MFVDGCLSPKETSDSSKYSLSYLPTLKENSSYIGNPRILGRILKFLCVFTGAYYYEKAAAATELDKKLKDSKLNQNLNLESN
jgi:hypothetical protein